MLTCRALVQMAHIISVIVTLEFIVLFSFFLLLSLLLRLVAGRLPGVGRASVPEFYSAVAQFVLYPVVATEKVAAMEAFTAD